MAKVKIVDLEPGMKVDLENDPYADPHGTNESFPFEYEVVVGSERETRSCIRVDFASYCCGFPPDHLVEVADDRAEGYEAE